MNKKLLFFLLIPFLGFSQVQIGQDISGDSNGFRFGNSVSFSDDGTTFIAGGMSSSSVKVYRINSSGNWIQLGQNFVGGSLGNNIAISSDGNIVAIGTVTNLSNIGYFSVYQNISGTWSQIGQNVMGNIGEQFGYSVAISSNGSVVAASAPYATGKGGKNSGKVRIYRNVSGTWTKIGSDIDDGEIVSEFSGIDIDLSEDGNTLAIGTLRNASSTNAKGKVRVYQNISGTWTKIGNDIVGENAFDTCSSVSLSSNGNIVAIGSPHNEGNGKESGSVRVYRNSSGNWIKVGQDIDGEVAGALSGYSVSFSADGTILAIGAPGNFTNKSGYIRIYKNISGSWVKMGQGINGKIGGENFGRSVSLSANGQKVVVGAFSNSDNGNLFGQVRVYDISGMLSTNDFVSQNFNIYPNPTSDVLNINLENNLVLEQVIIYNNLGQVVKTSTENVIDVSHLATGLYFVEVTTNQGKATKKVIVN
ncbi:Por secretion system C-terminal sorting domain-containing protein [Paenimyroides ummariense]|uniref:Por secretion system C-terminal sorting domain-containing protein n=1 Tax=Paenimyroides ummariense TaxID=913024 RepID=A0A1I5D177_9FLAO|nr:T9SS type A sorting domain-containing protein [Paenimyroides ummariense]SFN92974.1 Por secretion system C-terminal sorting domain-containing protein [Paenimyroides ummariense]